MENVLGIRDAKHLETYNTLVENIDNIGFDVSEKELCALDFGVPQTRRRVIVCGLRKDSGYLPLILRKRNGISTVRDAISHLPDPVYFKYGLKPEDIPEHPNHWTMKPRSIRFSNPDRYENDGRSFKRLHWEKASPTVAYGHREIHIHPNGHRRLSIFEAMLLQGFPSEFILTGNLSEQVEQVSNAVPPPLAKSVALAVTRALKGALI
jgi:DNA (cytosine-5)-methyltransferase 1